MTPTRSLAARPWSPAKAVDLLLALAAHAAVGLAWAATAASVMGSVGVARRIVTNSEFAWDTGRLPQPWAIPLAMALVVVAHAFFRWAMRRYRRGEAAYGPVVLAWAGAFLGVAYGAYLWPPPVLVGSTVGPHSGESQPWGTLAWVAYHARVWLPAVVGIVTAILAVASRNSPLVVWWRGGATPRRSRTADRPDAADAQPSRRAT